MAKACKHGGYAFGEFRLDPEKKMLYRGDGEVVLPPKVIETLVVLVENRGEIVSKADLIDKVWSDSIVEEQSLSQHLYLLRKTLGEEADGRPIIETFRRRGYRFNAETTVIKAEAPANDQSRPPGSNYFVKREGNVLKVAEWDPAPETLEEAAHDQPIPAIKETKEKRPLAIFAVAAVLATCLLISTYLLWPERNAASAESAGDATTTFLTNGVLMEGVTISANGDYFAYHEQDGPTARLWLQQTGQSGRVEILPASERRIGPKTFSTDGQFLFFVADENGNEKYSLFRVPTLGGLQTKVLENVQTPVTFSPDGKEMAFVRFDRPNSSSSLVSAAIDGRNEKTLIKHDGNRTMGMGSAWSPDGKLIAFASIESDGKEAFVSIVAVELSSGEIVKLSKEKWDTCYRMQWTADGRGLVFIGTRLKESTSSRRDQIFYLSYPEGNSRKLTNEGNRHDPGSLGITSKDEAVVLPLGRSSQIWSMDVSGGSRTSVQITRGTLDGRTGIAPLPDGRIGYITRTGESMQLWIMNADGSDPKQLTSEPSFIEELRASPDGRFFVFSGVVDGKSRLFRINPDGTGLSQMTNGKHYEVDSSVSPDGKWVIYDGSVLAGVYAKNFIWRVSSSGGEPEKLSQNECVNPHFSPDGALFSCVAGENGQTISVIRFSDGAIVSTLKPRATSRLYSGSRWVPDGQALVYSALDGTGANLWLQPISGGEPSRLTDFSGGDIYNFAFSIDGKRLYLARGNPIRDAMMISNFR